MFGRKDNEPKEIVDGNGDTWRNGSDHMPGRNGEPLYYPTTGPEGPSLTPSEIDRQYGSR
jgi:hypothetical protein